MSAVCPTVSPILLEGAISPLYFLSPCSYFGAKVQKNLLYHLSFINYFVSLQQIIGMLEVKDATIAAGERTLARGLSFIAKDGEITCITGPKGSGKTIFLRTLMGFLPVASGFVSVDGELLTVLSAPDFRRMMVYLPQQVQLLAHQMTPEEAVVPEPDDYAVWNELLPPAVTAEEPLPLGPDAIFSLASQTLAHAVDRSIVIADEPAAWLTPELSMQMLQLLRSQAEAGKTVLIASRLPLLVENSDQVINVNNE